MQETEIKLLVATHVHGAVHPAFASSLAQLGYRLGVHQIPCAITLFRDSDVSRGRNQAANAALELGYSHLMFIDADMEFGADDVVRLLAHGKELVGGPYRRKNANREYNFEYVPHAEKLVAVCGETGCHEVLRTGTGFMMIARVVLEQMAAAMPEARYKERTKAGGWRDMVRFFSFALRETPNGVEEFSEDFNFCEQWRALGGKIWIDPSLKLGHWGDDCWWNDLADLAVEPCPSF